MNVISINKIQIVIITAHGREELPYSYGDKVLDCLRKNNIPWSGVSIYKLTKNDELQLFPQLEANISSLDGIKELQVFFNRNINPFLFSLNNLNIVESAQANNEDPLSSEYIYQEINNKTSSVTNHLKKLSQSECQEVISNCVSKFIETNLVDGDSMVVGISGGGDSNALLHGLMAFKKFKINIIPVILKGTYDWDQGVLRAEQLCQKYELELMVIE